MNVRQAGACPPTAPPHRPACAVGSAEPTHSNPLLRATVSSRGETFLVFCPLSCWLQTEQQSPLFHHHTTVAGRDVRVKSDQKVSPNSDLYFNLCVFFCFFFKLCVEVGSHKRSFYLKLCFLCCEILSGSRCVELCMRTTRMPPWSCLHRCVPHDTLYQKEVQS